jgi:putative membrane-bound dehydrogenase-like protein
MRKVFSAVVLMLGLWQQVSSANDMHDSMFVDPSLFEVAEGLEIKLWAKSPMLFNPANMDIDAEGRVWVAEARNYRSLMKDEKGDRVVVLQDTNGDGSADTSHVFVQDKALRAPLGIAVIGNRIFVASSPSMIVYTDVDNDLVFNPEVDRREVFLGGFGGENHDHSLHSITVGPNGQFYFNVGNAGSFKALTDKDGFTLSTGSFYSGKEWAGSASDDGFVYVGGMAMRINPDGSGLRPIGHNFRNSYEQTVTSFGDVFQNDNDDPPASRTTFLIEYGNLGYASRNGLAQWGVTKKPGMSTAVAEWRQPYPGYIPAGDVYGGGAPTGIAFYENGSMQELCKGMLLSCEPTRNVVFWYRPMLEGAGYALGNNDLLSSNPEKKFEGADFARGFNEKSRHKLFRPSDVAIGPDGAIYVADWYDARVGGHGARDPHSSGNIYRMTRKGENPATPAADFDSLEGLVAALQSAAVNVRGHAFIELKALGAKAIPAVTNLLKHENEFIRARALWLLPQLGEKGVQRVTGYLSDDNAMMRVTAFRSLRFVESDTLTHAAKLATDSSAAVRREVALCLRYVAFADCKDILLDLIKGYDGKDRSYLEAWGIAADNKAADVFAYCSEKLDDDALLLTVAWRLHTDAAIPMLKQAALDKASDDAQREWAMDGIAFNTSYNAKMSMEAIRDAGVSPANVSIASWWLRARGNSDWAPFHNAPLEITQDYLVPQMPTSASPMPSIDEIVKLKPSKVAGRAKVAACYMCHQLGADGNDFGPNLSAWGAAQPIEMIVKSILDPNADIAHGFECHEFKLKNGKTVQGFIQADDVYVSVKTISGPVVFAAADIASRRKMEQSVMIAGQHLGMDAQAIRDVSELLRLYRWNPRKKTESF